MGAGTAISGGLGLVGGAVKYFEGRRMEREAQAAIDRFEWQKLENPYEDLQVSRLGADLQREEAARNTATITEALRSGGVRSIVGGLGRVQQENNLVNNKIAAELDQQQRLIDFSSAGQDVRNQQVIEQRQANELQGYGQMLNTGLGIRYQGLGNMINSGMMLGSTLQTEDSQKSSVNDFTSFKNKIIEPEPLKWGIN